MRDHSFVDLLHAPTRAAQDRMALLCAIAELGGNVVEDALIARMAKTQPPWTWEVVVHCCSDLADGGALERVRNERGDTIGWRITDAVAHHLAVCAASGVTVTDAMQAPAWLSSLPSAPRPTTTASTVMKAVES